MIHILSRKEYYSFFVTDSIKNLLGSSLGEVLKNLLWTIGLAVTLLLNMFEHIRVCSLKCLQSIPQSGTVGLFLLSYRVNNYVDRAVMACVAYHLLLTKFRLTLKMPRKPASENVVCLCCLLNILANFSNLFLHKGNQCGP